VDLFIPGGRANETPYADLFVRMSGSGGTPMGPIDKVGGISGLHQSPVATHLMAVVPDGNVVNGLAEVADEARCREISSSLFVAIKKALARPRDEADQSEDLAARTLLQGLYPGHPY